MSISVRIIYDDDKRYNFPIEIVKKALKLSDSDIKKIEVEIKKEVAKL